MPEGETFIFAIDFAMFLGVMPVPFAPAYAASKHGVVAYTRSWAVSEQRAELFSGKFCCV